MTHRRGVWLVLACVVTAALAWTSAERADGFTGTRAAKRLAGQMLRFYKHVNFLSATLSGNVVYCPQFHEGYFIGVPNHRPRGCTARATVTEVMQLSHGDPVVKVGHVTAPQKPQLTFVEDSSGEFVLDPTRGCWRKNLRAPPRGPEFSFSRNERLTIAGRRGHDALLKGTIPHVLTEIDRIDTRTHELRSVHLVTAGRPRLVNDFTVQTTSQGPAVPARSPSC